MDDTTITRIVARTGHVTRLLSRRRVLLDHLNAVNADSRPTVPVTVRAATTFEMHLPPQILHRTLEVELAAVERDLAMAAAVPLDWDEAAPPVAAVPAPTSSLPYTEIGGTPPIFIGDTANG